MKVKNILIVVNLLFSGFLLQTGSVALAEKLTLYPVYTADALIVYDAYGFELEPGEIIDIKIPDQYKGEILDFASIAHRQDPNDEGECTAEKAGRDCLPGYSSFEFRNENGWHAWGGKGSGPHNSKFAELRYKHPETDNLYEWRRKGALSIETGKVNKDRFFLEGARVRSLGDDSVIIHRLIIKFLPPEPLIIDDTEFSEGFSFGDYETTKGRSYPGNASMGDYGNSLALNKYQTPRHSKIPSDWSLQKGGIRIYLQPGKKLSLVDIAVGDMKRVPKGGNPENYRGGARVSVKHGGGGLSSYDLMKHENVGTNGVMRATPKTLDRIIGNGEYVEIQIPSKGVAQIMGIRVGYH